MEMTGYDGLAETSVFKGNMAAGGKQEIETAYYGLALLRFTEGQSYPVLVGNESFTLNIGNPAEPPSFTGSRTNMFFYSLLAGTEPEGQQDDFALLLIRARQLLESSYSIHNVTELSAKRKELHEFVHDHYDSLRHSDMVRRLVGQLFMMLEYVDYHVPGTPTADIKIKY